MWTFGYRTLFRNEPNKYDDLYFKTPDNSFVLKNSIFQKIYPSTHLYISNPSNIIGIKPIMEFYKSQKYQKL